MYPRKRSQNAASYAASAQSTVTPTCRGVMNLLTVQSLGAARVRLEKRPDPVRRILTALSAGSAQQVPVRSGSRFAMTPVFAVAFSVP